MTRSNNILVCVPVSRFQAASYLLCLQRWSMRDLSFCCWLRNVTSILYIRGLFISSTPTIPSNNHAIPCAASPIGTQHHPRPLELQCHAQPYVGCDASQRRYTVPASCNGQRLRQRLPNPVERRCPDLALLRDLWTRFMVAPAVVVAAIAVVPISTSLDDGAGGVCCDRRGRLDCHLGYARKCSVHLVRVGGPPGGIFWIPSRFTVPRDPCQRNILKMAVSSCRLHLTVANAPFGIRK